MRANFQSALLILVLCHSPLVTAQDRTHGSPGVVVDESGGVIAGARLVVRSTQGAVVQQSDTATDGSFTIDRLPAGTYWLEVAARHFRARELTVTVDGVRTTPLRVVLSLAPMQSDVTVTAQRGMIAE